MTFDQLLFLFQTKHPQIDETAFYFSDDPEEIEHFIGYIPKYKDKVYKKPYWIGKCDIENGCEFETADELFCAKVFDGESIRDRWDQVVLFQIGGIETDFWMQMNGNSLPNN